MNNYHPLDEELLSPPLDDLALRFEEYGTTPPRTRMKIKSRDWERKKAHAVASVGSYVGYDKMMFFFLYSRVYA